MNNPTETAAAAESLVPPELIAAAAADEKAATAKPLAPGETPPPPVNHAAEAADLVAFAAQLIFPLYPSLATVYTAEVQGKLAAALAPLCAKYGLSQAALFGRWAPEFGFAIVAVPLIPPTIAAIRADRAPAKPVDPPPAPPAKPKPSPLDAFPELNSDAKTKKS